MAWIDDALPMPSARAVEADEALDAAVSALVAVTASVAAMQLFTAFVLERPAEAALYGAGMVATGAAAFVPLESHRRRLALTVSAAASVVVWLAMVPVASDGATALVVLSMAAASAYLARHLTALQWEEPPESRATDIRDACVGWIEEDEAGSLPA